MKILEIKDGRYLVKVGDKEEYWVAGEMFLSYGMTRQRLATLKVGDVIA